MPQEASLRRDATFNVTLSLQAIVDGAHHGENVLRTFRAAEGPPCTDDAGLDTRAPTFVIK